MGRGSLLVSPHAQLELNVEDIYIRKNFDSLVMPWSVCRLRLRYAHRPKNARQYFGPAFEIHSEWIDYHPDFGLEKCSRGRCNYRLRQL